MSIHAIFTITIDNPESIAQYREVAADALTKHGGAVVQASPVLTVLDGSDPAPSMAAVLAFPDAQAAKAWHSDPALAHVHDLRRNAGPSTLILLA
jgi:uncharacterized protein (DUF1330 family)